MVFSKYTDLLPKEVLNENAQELQRPDEEAVKEVRHAVLCMYGKTGWWPSDLIMCGTIDLKNNVAFFTKFT